jgi:KaiC/GvpD/RAD55 family RecA-like ATPase
LQFLAAGLRHGEGAIALLATQEPKEFRAQLSLLGVDMVLTERAGLLKIIDWTSYNREDTIGVDEDGSVLKCGSELVNIGIAITKVTSELATGKKRAYVQFIPSALTIAGFSTVLNIVLRICAKFKNSDTTALFFLDKESIPPKMLDVFRTSFEGIIELEQTELEGRLLTKLAVTSMKNVLYSPGHGFMRIVGFHPVIEPYEPQGREPTHPLDSLLSVEKELKHDPYNQSLWVKKAQLLVTLNRLEDALVTVSMATEPDFELKNRAAWKVKAEILSRLGRMNEAELCRRIASLQQEPPATGSEAVPSLAEVSSKEPEYRERTGKEAIEKVLDIMLGSVTDEKGKTALARVLAPLTVEREIVIEKWLDTLEKERETSKKKSEY